MDCWSLSRARTHSGFQHAPTLSAAPIVVQVAGLLSGGMPLRQVEAAGIPFSPPAVPEAPIAPSGAA